MTISTISQNTGATFTGVEETSIIQVNPTTNYVDEFLSHLNKYGVNDHAHVLVEVSGLSNIPPVDVISDVVMRIYLQFTSVPVSTTATVREILTPWVSSQATWNEASTGVSWATGGALGGADRDITSLGELGIDAAGVYLEVNTAGLTALFQDWHDGTTPNYGLHLERTDAGEDATTSRVQGANSSDYQRIEFVITHTVGTTPAVISIDSPVRDGDTGNALSVLNFTNNISTLTFTDAGSNFSEPCVIQSGTGDGPYLWDAPDITSYLIDTLGAPLASASHVLHLVAGDGIATADSSTVVRLPQIGWAVVELVVPSTAEGSLFFEWAVPPVATDQVYYPTADNTSVDSAGIPTTDKTTGLIPMLLFDTTDGYWKLFNLLLTSVVATITGTITSTITETNIVTGGRTLIITLIGANFVTGTAFDANRQNILNGITSAQSETFGFNNEVRDKELVTSVVRTSDQVCTITLSASASYDITLQEILTVTVPASCLDSL